MSIMNAIYAAIATAPVPIAMVVMYAWVVSGAYEEDAK